MFSADFKHARKLIDTLERNKTQSGNDHSITTHNRSAITESSPAQQLAETRGSSDELFVCSWWFSRLLRKSDTAECTRPNCGPPPRTTTEQQILEQSRGCDAHVIRIRDWAAARKICADAATHCFCARTSVRAVGKKMSWVNSVVQTRSRSICESRGHRLRGNVYIWFTHKRSWDD